jgi:hypothetical protein
MLASATMKSAARRREALLIPLFAYLPFLAWSLIGAGWTLWHHPFTLWFTGFYLLFVIHSLVFRRTVGGILVMIGIGACHLTAAFALHTWLGLPIWTVPVFLAVSTALLIVVRMRVASARIRLGQFGLPKGSPPDNR